MTVSTLARAAGLSRSTILYYESIGLLRRPGRSGGNYRVYGEADLQTIRQICSYRAAGLTLDDIRAILKQSDSDLSDILQRRLVKLREEVDRLCEHQRAIARLLHESAPLGKEASMTKQKWVEIIKAAGFSDGDMHNCHAQFERTAPEHHDEFLRFLHIPQAEVESIRRWSRLYPNGTSLS
jgi:DNA-binding transcriptional MerR regulator